MAANGMWNGPEREPSLDRALPRDGALPLRELTSRASKSDSVEMSQGFPSVQRRLTAGDEKPQRWMLGEMVGRSPAMERLFLQMRYLAGHLRCALIEGERGAGKTLTAKTLHRLGPARDREFVALSAGRFLSGAAHVAELERASGGTLYLSRVDTLNHE